MASVFCSPVRFLVTCHVAATRFADEELGHAAELERMIAALPENGLDPREEDDEPYMPE